LEHAVRAFFAILFCVFFLCLPHPTFAKEINLIRNGDFSLLTNGIPAEWGAEKETGGSSAMAGPHGERCLKIASSVRQYATADQYIFIDGRKVHKVRFRGSVRFVDVVRGRTEDDVLRAFVTWFDAKGRQIGETAETGDWTGSSSWRTFDVKFPVPTQTARASITLGLNDCTGVCYFHNLSLTVLEGDLSYRPSDSSQNQTRDWWPFLAEESPAAGTPIDVSYLLDAPAGKHGLVTAKNGHFYFADGTRARFWGFDIMGKECFPDHAKAVKLADRLARMGVNIIRLHHMDAGWAIPNIFDSEEYDDTRHLSKTSLDNLDYFLAQLKKRGVYIYLDWLVNRKFQGDDNVQKSDAILDGAKIVAHFDPRMIQLEKEYMRQLLSHRNAYTGIRYADEPQIALSEVINEDSLFYEDWYTRVPPRYLAELATICRKYEPKANPAKHPFDVPTVHALYKIESNYYREMRDYLKKLGLRCPTTGSNHWENIGPALLCDSQADYIDRHFYWDHPKSGYGWQQEFDNLPMLGSYDESLLENIAGTKVAGKPMVVTEWCFCWINDYIAEGPLFGASYACAQDWDAMIWFDISSVLPNSAMKNEFDIANKPHLFAQWAAASILFHRQDVSPFVDTKEGVISAAKLMAGKPLSSALNTKEALTKRVEVKIGQSQNAVGAGVHRKDPLQVNWNIDSGMLLVNTPRTLALDGFLSDRKMYDYGWVRVQVSSPFCVLWMTSLDNKPLPESKHFLVTVAARGENTGMRFNSGRTHLVTPGKAPVLMEPVQATLTFPQEVEIIPLNQDGMQGNATKVRVLRTNANQTFWYEINRE